ncbi:(E)-4-hydroxy-3-methylbut-2-enyl-diphosphate synthase [Marinilabilia rubra]|uniref:4-hydroxy-3-methylbut-2-en-1-yl diphosphate synthase (flavodoxin) n=1 Tax=Marinilabilia rubra TaxID=2162893 RepID=A0A2U2B8K9_9BACT|nr:(E)-4-hydroxy-3-methylbut-2-enyl-diphosphate synthase [Marinilabilia rubra]PWD99374.1 4-hydroxy-3-methylbut-2-en-1-yl diphosphate synthase [Marinilabilia rubra]
MSDPHKFCQSFFQYNRNKTLAVNVGDVTIGGESPVRVQSMTTTNTLDTEATAEQSLKIAEAGGQIVRITTQGRREALNLKNIKEVLSRKGCNVPLVADVHFNPSAAEIAATLIEKVRINPGNFTGGAKKFREFEAGGPEDQAGLQQIREKLVPFLKLCKEHGTAIRIGTNHGSLSDRIMSKYGDTPEGMVESCMEYLRICREEDFNDIVLSIKASNTRVMVHTVRLLVAAMHREEMSFPLHLGVTEAGSGEDGRLKSAVGIGALLADGIGDTIRVSLTEPPENEIPVAQKLVKHFVKRSGHAPIPEVSPKHYSPLSYQKRQTHSVLNVGGENATVVVADIRDQEIPEKVEEMPEFVLCNATQMDAIPDKWDGVLRIVSRDEIPGLSDRRVVPLFNASDNWVDFEGPAVVSVSFSDLDISFVTRMKQKEDVVLLLHSNHENPLAEQRAFFLEMQNQKVTHPVIIWRESGDADAENFQITSAADTGILFLDGYGDGICLKAPNQDVGITLSTSFGILQASRVRFSKTEYISCPGCGRTLFDLQATTEKVRARTAHLKGLKIAVMGCIVNGIGEMADADYGYVGAGRGRISLFRNRELIRKNIPEKDAVQQLVDLIKEYGDWREPVE